MKKVLELPAFRRLLGAYIINELALSVGAVALALLVYRRTGSATGAAAFFLCAEFAPAFISPLLVARLSQRPSRRVIALLYASESVVFLVLVSLVQRFALASVLALVLLSGSIAITASVLVRATWTSAAPRANLLREANAIANGGFAICFMLGPAIGGAITAAYGTTAALLVVVGGYGLNALLIATARGLPGPRSEREPAAGRLPAALTYVRREPLLRRLLSLQAAGTIFFTISIPVEVVFAQHTLHAGARGYGILLAAWGGGAIVGSGAYARWRRLSSRLLITVGTGLLGAGFLVMAIAPSLAVALFGAAVAGVGNGIQAVSLRTALQEAVSRHWMALVLSLNESLVQAMPGVGIVIGGGITALAGPRIALAVGAVGSVMVAVLIWMKLAAAGTTAVTKTPPSGRSDSDTILPMAARQP